MNLYLKKFVLLCISTFFFTVSFAQSVPYYYPEKGAVWEEKNPEEWGIDTEGLAKVVQFAQENEYSGPTDLRQAILKGFEREPYHEIVGPTKKRGGPAGMILKNGYVVAQWGDVKRVDMTFSVTKSYLSTVAGLAIADNLIASVDDPVSQYVWDGTFEGSHNEKITWRHLLTQSSDWSGTLWGQKDWADRPPKEGEITDWKYRALQEPGTIFEYNDVRVNLLAYSLLHVWRKPLPQVLKESIMDPIGASTTWRWYGYEHSWVNIDGVHMQSVSGGGHSGGGLFISTEDHARFGLLFLSNGQWKGQQLISPEWIQMATTPSKAEARYGFMWWLKSFDQQPEDNNYALNGYNASGFGGNYIVVEPEYDLVVIFRWLQPGKLDEARQMILDLM